MQLVLCLGLQWLIALAVSLGVGHLVVGPFLDAIRRAAKLDPAEKPGGPKRLPRWITGAVERLVFTILAAAVGSSALTPMMGWLALKLAANWNHKMHDEDPDARTYAMTALLAGLVSMFFAFVGGLIASGTLTVGICTGVDK